MEEEQDRRPALIEARDRFIEGVLNAETVREVDGRTYIIINDPQTFLPMEVCREDYITRIRARAETLLG